MDLKYYIAIYLLIMSLISFSMFYIDKRKAVKHKWRIPESTLLWSVALGGAVGAWLGMHLFHHKTKHPKFYIGVPLILILWLLALSAAILYFG